MLFLVLLACSGETESEAVPAATLAWLTPADGDTVTAGDVSCSLVADGFTLSDPAKHNDGVPVGYIEISVDDEVVLQTGTTTPTISLDAGEHTLSAQLFLADGDEVLTDGTNTCGEDDGACAPVIASISVTAE